MIMNILDILGIERLPSSIDRQKHSEVKYRNKEEEYCSISVENNV
jgi:hypothetical protein